MPMPKPDPVTFKSNVKDGASNVKINTLVTVKSDWGTLTKVKLSYANTDRQGRKQQGTVAGKDQQGSHQLDSQRSARARCRVQVDLCRQELG